MTPEQKRVFLHEGPGAGFPIIVETDPWPDVITIMGEDGEDHVYKRTDQWGPRPAYRYTGRADELDSPRQCGS